MKYKIDLSTAKEPEFWRFCDRCPDGLVIGQEMEQEAEYLIFGWECVECGEIVISRELNKSDRDFLQSMNIRSIPWDWRIRDKLKFWNPH